jgi:hypothetical protein
MLENCPLVLLQPVAVVTNVAAVPSDVALALVAPCHPVGSPDPMLSNDWVYPPELRVNAAPKLACAAARALTAAVEMARSATRLLARGRGGFAEPLVRSAVQSLARAPAQPQCEKSIL